MAYAKHTWVCGEIITDTLLNNIEEGIEEALDCCEGGGSSLPDVTTADNDKVLTVVDGEWKKAKKDFECTTALIFQETIDATDTSYYPPAGYGEVQYDTPITAPFIIISIDDEPYCCVRDYDNGGSQFFYGAKDLDFSKFPFVFYPILEDWHNCYMLFETPGTYNVKVEAVVPLDISCCLGTIIDQYAITNWIDGEGICSVRSILAYESTGFGSTAEGRATTASGECSHAEGYFTTASGDWSHAEGNNPTASGNKSHAEGNSTTASGEDSHAEGSSTLASGNSSHAEGSWTKASGNSSHAEGASTTASEECSHAEGNYTTASGRYSHAEGNWTIANHANQHVCGECNVADPSTAAATARGTYVEIVGNGANSNARSNARTLDWSGNETIAGTLTQSSDKRLKEHIDYLGEDAEEFVRGLKPAHYIKDDAHHVGFYAQDVEEVDKWDCMTGEMNGYMTLGYTEIIAPLVAYCQSLEKRIQELENK